MTQVSTHRPATFGLIGFLLGMVSLVVVVIQLSAFFEPQKESSGSAIGEIAAEIKLSAKRVLSGEPKPEPVPEPVPWKVKYHGLITVTALVLAGIAAVFGGIGLFRNEPHRLSFMAVGLGLSAVVMHYFFWLALLICGVALMISIIGNLDSITG
ncbi:MAG: hypothetical protein ACSHXD_17265 [Marinosulfonomonas sp.]